MLTNEMTGIISELLFRKDCSEWYLFGSHVTGEANENSDIDIGVKGLPVRKFLKYIPHLKMQQKGRDINSDHTNSDHRDMYDKNFPLYEFWFLAFKIVQNVTQKMKMKRM